jgi:pyruvate dehydrogenase E2 component (dihydrolipoamide acetyltransferase)/2-oxoisovalerate dehydrogenase E2 component (dihydrolipoyl transacylase)
MDLASIKGSGRGGRVLMGDLEAATHQHAGEAAAGNGRETVSKPPTTAAFYVPGTRVKLRRLRRTIAETMTRATRTIPHYSLVDECDATTLVQLRESLREVFQRESVRLTYLPFVVRAAVAALRELPLVNASLDESAEEIVLHDRYHIGIATATPEGLIVPVLHDADQMSLVEIAREIQRLVEVARSGRARPEDLRGGTFTITSIGNLGGLISTPIIHPPEVAIMGVGRIVRRPVYDASGALRPADLVYLSFSFDHRVVDGDVGAQFARAVIQRLENPAPLLLAPTFTPKAAGSDPSPSTQR